MPRTARASAANVVYHVLNRGNARAEVFHQDEDYAAFVALLAEACERLPLRVIGYWEECGDILLYGTPG